MKPSSNGIFSQSTHRNVILTTGTNNMGKLLVLLALLAKVGAQNDMEYSYEHSNDSSDTTKMPLIFMTASILAITLVSLITFLHLESIESIEELRAK